jgi:hypothetical protein
LNVDVDVDVHVNVSVDVDVRVAVRVHVRADPVAVAVADPVALPALPRPHASLHPSAAPPLAALARLLRPQEAPRAP